MKHIINILVILVLAGLCVGAGYLMNVCNDPNCTHGVLFLPLFVLMLLWGIHLSDNY